MEALLFLLFALFSIISSLMERRKRKREVELAREKQKERSERQENEIEEDIFTEFRDVPDDEVIAQSTEEIKSGSVPDLVVRDFGIIKQSLKDKFIQYDKNSFTA